MKGYVQLRRGLLDHFKIMSSSEIKVYIGALLLANYKTAKVNITLAELGDIISVDKKITLNSLHRLDKLGYVKFTPAKNQWQSGMIEIINYNGRVKNTIPTTTAPTIAPTTALPTTLSVNSNNDKDLQKPNKYKEVLKNKYKYLKEAIFEDVYKNYLEMRKKLRKPATDRAQDLVLKELHKYDLETAVKMLEQSIINSWQGIFPLKSQQKFIQGGFTISSLTDEAIEKTLGKIATKDMIKDFIKDLPQSVWNKVANFLRRRYPDNGEKAYMEAERELIKEIRQVSDKLNKLTEGIGNDR